MRRLLLTVLVAALVAPAALADNQPQQNPSQLCSAQRTAMGQNAFDQLYGANANDANAFGKCVAKMAREQQQNQATASGACRSEQSDANFASSHGGKTFDQFYGSGRHGSNAFGKCVSMKAQAMTAQQQQPVVNAARACRAEQRAGAAAFAAKYGTNASKSNAFGKCVSARARS